MGNHPVLPSIFTLTPNIPAYCLYSGLYRLLAMFHLGVVDYPHSESGLREIGVEPKRDLVSIGCDSIKLGGTRMSTPQELYETAQRLYYNKNDTDSAREIFKQIISEYPTSAQAGYAQEQLNKIDKIPNYGKTDANSGTTYQGGYETSRTIAQFVSLVGWVTLAAGVIAAFYSLKSFDRQGIFVFIPSLASAISGFLLVMTGQMSRAIVDIADNTRQMLAHLKQQKNN